MLSNLQNYQSNVISFQHQGPFSLQDARTLLPIVIRVTRRWHKEAEKLTCLFERTLDPKKRFELDDQYRHILLAWSQQIKLLGAEAKGAWLVDFDSGDGNYWCWQYPEPDIKYFHSHDNGFTGRRPIQN